MTAEPDVHLENTRAALRFICGETDHICRLCLSTTLEASEISIDEVVTMKRVYMEETISLMDMMLELDVPIEYSMPKVLCKDCAGTLIQSYLFKRLCTYSNDQWNEAFNKLDKGLQESKTVSTTAQCMYLIVNKNDNVIFTSRKAYSMKNKKNALAKIKSIVKSRQHYIKQKSVKPYSKQSWPKQSNGNLMCSTCGKIFESEMLLSKHMTVHSDERNPCPKCAKVFPTWKQVLGHMDRMHKPKVIQCNKCSKRFSTKQMLACHVQMHHVAATCKLCFKPFPSKYMLRAHLDKHVLNSCPTCGKTYRNKNTFKIHLNICGVVDKPLSFFCDICGKGYVRKNGIRTHLKVDHGFGKIFSCNWCGKRFDAISRLKMHTVKHTKERNFACDLCGGKFVTHAAMVYHKRLHTGEKPFHCDMCDESFLSASRRMEHKHRKHFNPTKECLLCNMKFVMTSQLKKHVNRHYNPQSKLYIPNAAPLQELVVETVVQE